LTIGESVSSISNMLSLRCWYTPFIPRLNSEADFYQRRLGEGRTRLSVCARKKIVFGVESLVEPQRGAPLAAGSISVRHKHACTQRERTMRSREGFKEGGEAEGAENGRAVR
jgi:hypothetical protein